MEKKHILVVDDDKSILELYEFMLSAANHEVTLAVDGLKAFTLFIRAEKCGSPFDLIITDLFMPEMDGNELIREIRARNASVPILATSGSSDKKTINQILSRRGTIFLEKPIDMKILQNIVDKIFIGEMENLIYAKNA